jgi:hypothetical protein
MTTANVHLEDVARAARQGFGLSIVASLLVLAAMLTAGLTPAAALLSAVALLAAGCASGGFGLVARVAMRPPRLPQRSDGKAETAVAPLRVPQPR